MLKEFNEIEILETQINEAQEKLESEGYEITDAQFEFADGVLVFVIYYIEVQDEPTKNKGKN